MINMHEIRWLYCFVMLMLIYLVSMMCQCASSEDASFRYRICVRLICMVAMGQSYQNNSDPLSLDTTP